MIPETGDFRGRRVGQRWVKAEEERENHCRQNADARFIT